MSTAQILFTLTIPLIVLAAAIWWSSSLWKKDPTPHKEDPNNRN